MQQLDGAILNKLTLTQYKELRKSNQIKANESYVITDIDEQLDNLIIYKESLDINNPIILRNLKDGLYKIYGYFKYNTKQTGISGADPFALVSIANGNNVTYAQIIDYNGNTSYEINDSSYKDKNDSGWIEVPLASGITQHNASALPVRYRKIGNRVRIEGAIKGITSKGKVVATIPSGYRPTKNQYIIQAGTGGRIDTYQLDIGGNIKFMNTTYTGTLNANDYHFITTEYFID